jgi:hypothetical protein
MITASIGVKKCWSFPRSHEADAVDLVVGKIEAGEKQRCGARVAPIAELGPFVR